MEVKQILESQLRGRFEEISHKLGRRYHIQDMNGFPNHPTLSQTSMRTELEHILDIARANNFLV